MQTQNRTAENRQGTPKPNLGRKGRVEGLDRQCLHVTCTPTVHWTRRIMWIALLPLKVGFPDLEARQDFVMAVIKDEEEAFNRTLGKGVAHFEKVPSPATLLPMRPPPPQPNPPLAPPPRRPPHTPPHSCPRPAPPPPHTHPLAQLPSVHLLPSAPLLPPGPPIRSRTTTTTSPATTHTTHTKTKVDRAELLIWNIPFSRPCLTGNHLPDLAHKWPCAGRVAKFQSQWVKWGFWPAKPVSSH